MERSNPDLFLLAASMRLAEGNPRKALDALDLVRLSGYKSFRSEYLAGLAYGDLERYTDAINCFKAAEELDKSQESKLLGEGFYLILAEFHERNGEKEKAFEIAENLLAQYPESPQCLNTLGYLWADNGLHLEKSLEMIQKALATEPDAPAYLDSLAWVLYK
jgi:tetratricopeptide (TPR) repeat protein